MTLAIWQSAILIVLALSLVSLALQVYGQKVNKREHDRTELLIKQNEELSRQIGHLQKEIDQLMLEMARILEENVQLNKEVYILNQDVNRLQERMGCSAACELKDK